MGSVDRSASLECCCYAALIRLSKTHDQTEVCFVTSTPGGELCPFDGRNHLLSTWKGRLRGK